MNACVDVIERLLEFFVPGSEKPRVSENLASRSWRPKIMPIAKPSNGFVDCRREQEGRPRRVAPGCPSLHNRRTSRSIIATARTADGRPPKRTFDAGPYRTSSRVID